MAMLLLVVCIHVASQLAFLNRSFLKTEFLKHPFSELLRNSEALTIVVLNFTVATAAQTVLKESHGSESDLAFA